jgi:hypothetical protein
MRTNDQGQFITTEGSGDLIQPSEIDPNLPCRHIDEPIATITTREPRRFIIQPTHLRAKWPYEETMRPIEPLHLIAEPSPGAFADALKSIDEPLGEEPWWLTQSKPPAGWGE